MMRRLVLFSLSLIALWGLFSCGGKDTPTGPKTSKTPAGTQHEMVPVPAGNLTMGANDGYNNERPVHTVYLETYYLDKYEVTNAQYQAFVQVTGRAQPAYADDSDFNGSQQPVVGMTWFDAQEYCAWAGLRLPTEAEWEKAARGTDGRTYPWGNEEADCSHAVMYGGGNGCGQLRTWPVGSKPAGVSPYGAHDLAGNVWEWVADWYDAGYYSTSPTRNPKGPENGSARVLRGGSWLDNPDLLRVSNRFSYAPTYRDVFSGFRCARDP